MATAHNRKPVRQTLMIMSTMPADADTALSFGDVALVPFPFADQAAASPMPPPAPISA
jgi:hypothetical protein